MSEIMRIALVDKRTQKKQPLAKGGDGLDVRKGLPIAGTSISR